jgi:hypothetical protein
MLRDLPPYSPRSQSIEQSFAKLKAHLRKAAERSIPALWDESEQPSTPLPKKSATTTSDTPGLGQTNGNPL